MSANSKRPWMVPSSPNVPWRTGKMTSRDWARLVECWVRSALALSWMDFVLLDLSRTGAGFVLPARRRCASVEVSHWPCLLMPMGITSYFDWSMALRMELAERRETSCSPERPPKRMPTRSFFFAGFFFMDSYKFLLVCRWARKKVGRGTEVVFAGVFRFPQCFLRGRSW